jgi:hypothetical protein
VISAGALLAALLVGSCSSGASPSVVLDGSSPGPTGTSPSPSAQPPSASPEPTAAPVPALPECSPAVGRSVDRVVGRQLAAFATGDVRGAYALASETFRAEVDLESFVAIIEAGYPEVAASASHSVAECRQPRAGVALALVSVTGRNGRTVDMVYRLVRQPAGWRVDGASTPQGVTIA